MNRVRARRVDKKDILELCPKFGRGPSCKYWCPYTEKSDFTELKAGITKLCFLSDVCMDEAIDNSPYCRRKYEELLQESPEKAEQWAENFIQNKKDKKDDS